MLWVTKLTITQLLFLILAFASGLAQALPYSNLVVFGDSLADSGNNAAVFDTQIAPPGTPPGTLRTPTPISSPAFIPQQPYATDRYSNGPVWVEYLASKIGLNAKASLLGGTNFAFGGAQTGPGGGSFPFSLTDQVEMYLGGAGGAADGNALYVVVGGGNDARAAVDVAALGGDPTAIIEAYVLNVANILTRLSTAGAQHILFVNVPNIGLTPALQTADVFFPGIAGVATGIAASMNSGINNAIAGLLPSLSADVVSFDFYALVTDAVNNPAAFGLADSTSACAADPACIAHPDDTLFWDGIHPTTAGHSLIAQAIFAKVPEPSTLALMLLVGLVFVSRRITWRKRS